jgi:hypothetical protein
MGEKLEGLTNNGIPEQVGNGVYRFKSCHESSLFLAIKKGSVENGGQL